VLLAASSSQVSAGESHKDEQSLQSLDWHPAGNGSHEDKIVPPKSSTTQISAEMTHCVSFFPLPQVEVAAASMAILGASVPKEASAIGGEASTVGEELESQLPSTDEIAARNATEEGMSRISPY